MDQLHHDSPPVLAEKLQANILKPHGRNYVCYLLLRFDPNKMMNVGEFLNWLQSKEYIFSHSDQLCAEEEWKNKSDAEKANLCNTKPGSWGSKPVCTLGFSQAFYDKIEGNSKKKVSVLQSTDFHFRSGIDLLNDPNPLYPKGYKEKEYRYEENSFPKLDAIICLAHDCSKCLKKEVELLTEDNILKSALLELKDNDYKNLICEYGFGAKAPEVFSPLGYKDGITEQRGAEELGRLTFRRERETTSIVSNKRDHSLYGTYLFFQKIELNHDNFHENVKRVGRRIMGIEEKINKEVVKAGGTNFKPEYEQFVEDLEWPVNSINVFNHQRLSKEVDALFLTLEEEEMAEWSPLEEAPLPKAVKAFAKAVLMGRFTNGTPLVLSADEVDGHSKIPFDYTRDASGISCPYQAHIRKVNPRTGGYTNANIVRRGSYYRGDADSFSGDEAPGGLLFVSMQKSITDQLIPLLRNMALDNQFDVVAYGNNAAVHFNYNHRVYNKNWIEGPKRITLKKVATYIGGDFFYVPSLVALDKYPEFCGLPPVTKK